MQLEGFSFLTKLSELISNSAKLPMASISKDMTVPSNYGYMICLCSWMYRCPLHLKYGLMSSKSTLKGLFAVFVFEQGEYALSLSQRNYLFD